MRLCTIYKNNYVALFDYYSNIDGDPVILIIKLSKKDLKKKVEGVLPDFVELVRDITDEEQYLARNMAL